MQSTVLCVPLILVLAAPASAENLATLVDQRVRGIEAKVVAWRRDIHQNPELSNREVR